jgi:hypothetical protein
MNGRGSSPVRRIDTRAPLIVCTIVVAVFNSGCQSTGIDAVDLVFSTVTERCTTVDRESYVSAMESLGRTPEVPDDPETAQYKRCYNRWTIDTTDAWMVGGDSPVEEGSTTGEVSDEEGQETGETTDDDSAPDDDVLGDEVGPPDDAEERLGEIPAGTYVGAFREASALDCTWLENEIVVEISDEGAVDGYGVLVYTCVTPRKSFDCEGFHEREDYYTISGQIAGDFREPVTLTRSHFESHDTTDCGELGERREEEWECECEGWISVDDGEMDATCNLGEDCEANLSGMKE